MAFVDDSKGYVATAGGARVEDYFALLKPRVMSLVVFTAIIGLLLAPGGINPVIGVIAILCIAIGAGGSGALNMWYDADIDAIMSRTANRPIPAGRVTRGEALALRAHLLGLFGGDPRPRDQLGRGRRCSPSPSSFTPSIYTMWLKRSTPQNIVIGGAAGAFPPMIGWAAVTGDITLASIVLFLIIFLWTPPHFWALALYKQGDYGAAGIPMMPNVAGEQATKLQILVYSVLLVAATLRARLHRHVGLALRRRRRGALERRSSSSPGGSIRSRDDVGMKKLAPLALHLFAELSVRHLPRPDDRSRRPGCWGG